MRKTKEQIREKFENYIAEYEEKIRLWQNVQVQTKKDGTPFKDLAKNFSGAKLVRPAYGFGDIELHVANYRLRIGGSFVEDKINLRELVKYSPVKVDESRIIREAYLEPYFYLTIPETMGKIERQIETYKKAIIDYQEQIEKLDSLYDEVARRIDDTMDFIRQNTENYSSLYYELREMVQKVGY